MKDILQCCATILDEVGFSSKPVAVGNRNVLVFEDSVMLGFILSYETPSEMVAQWTRDAEAVLDAHRFVLRRGGQKAWNTYLVLLAQAEADYIESVALAGIEEDLTGTRKIARAGVNDVPEARMALLSLLPLQAAPKLDAVDIFAEIRERASELPVRAIDAFLFLAEESVVLQVLEESQ